MSNPRRDRNPRHSVLRAVSRGPTFEHLENRTLLSAVPPLGADLAGPASDTVLVGPAQAPMSQSVGTFDFAVTNAWNTGFQGSLVLTNTSGQDWTSWTVEFDMPHDVSSIWNTVIESHDGNRFAIKNASWNGNLADGQSVSLGFIGKLTPGDSPQAPTNIVINNESPPVNLPPTPVDDVIETQSGDAVVIDYLFNDTDPDGDPLSLVNWTSPEHGTVAQNADGMFVYTPDAGFVGGDSFEYTVTDGQDAASATVSITVKPADPSNTDPAAVDDTANTTKDTAVLIDVLGNDIDYDGDSLVVVDWTSPNHGTVTQTTDGRLNYMPAAGFVGTDAFTYTITDGYATASATVRVSVDGSGRPGRRMAGPFLRPVSRRDPSQRLQHGRSGANFGRQVLYACVYCRGPVYERTQLGRLLRFRQRLPDGRN